MKQNREKGFFFFVLLFGLLAIIVSGCSTDTAEAPLPTLTLAPNVSRTPRFTATPIPSRTALPTQTLTPSETSIPPTPSNSPTPSATPPILGSVVSLQSINVREGPGVNFAALEALRPATRVEILGRNGDGTWLNIRLEDGKEGWVAAELIRIQPTSTAFPTLTSSPDQTQLALGTSMPTALFGGGTITPTPPRSLSEGATPTPVEENANAATVVGLQLPDLESINLTATALAGGGLIPEVNPTQPNGTPLGGPTGGPLVAPTATQSPVPGSTARGNGVDVLAYCDDRSLGSPPPGNLAAGSTIDVFWNWFAATRQQVMDHLDTATYTITLDGKTLSYREFQTPIRQENGQFIVYWYVPSEPLEAGQHRITYRVTWSEAITDGFDNFGPGTAHPEQTGSCTFNVR